MSRLASLRARLPAGGRGLALLAVIVPLLGLFGYVILHSGPMAPVAVTTEAVRAESITPTLYGIGTVEARYVHRIGPIFAGRIARLEVEVGDRVQAGQLLGEMDPVDLEQRLAAQAAGVARSSAMVREAQARRDYAHTQSARYEQLLPSGVVSQELVAGKRQELQIASAGLSAARDELARVRAEHAALSAQRDSLQLRAPFDGLVTAREAEPGTTVVAGQAVIELVDPHSLWIDARFDQGSAEGLAAGLLASIELRSRPGQALAGRMLRVEPRADAVTEEARAKVDFVVMPDVLPPLGELAEVTADLPPLAAAPVIPRAAIVRNEGRLGVWQVGDGNALRFTQVELGAADLHGRVQVSAGLEVGDRVVVYSEKALGLRSRIQIVERIAGVAP